MKKTIIFWLALLAALAVGLALGVRLSSTSAAIKPAQQTREILYYQAPMDPDYRSDKPGKSPMGMELAPVYADGGSDADPAMVKIDPRIVMSLGVRSDPVTRGALARRIETVGYVAYDEDSLHQISTRVDGWIERLAIKSSGERVERGQVLFELYSPTLVNAQEEFLAALSTSSTALHQASRERLAALGMSGADIKRIEKERKVKRRVVFRAQTSGVVAHLGVREGVFITPSANVMSIASLDQVWVIGEVFERQAAWVVPGQAANVALDYLPAEQWSGQVDYVYPELDPTTRTLKVRLRLENPSVLLRPNMFARLTIFTGDSVPVMHVPTAALIRGGTVDRVVLDLGDGHYRSQAVQVGIESDDRVEIRSGLSEGDRIVTSGQFLIDSESKIDVALKRFEAPTTSQEKTEEMEAMQ